MKAGHVTGTFDLALMTYTATELPHVSSTLAASAILWQKLANNGVLIIIEPGTPDGFNTIRAVRNMLLDCCPPSSFIFYIHFLHPQNRGFLRSLCISSRIFGHILAP